MFFKPKRRYRVLYHDEFKPYFSWSIPMTLEDARNYLAIFKEAREIVEIVSVKETTKDGNIQRLQHS